MHKQNHFISYRVFDGFKNVVAFTSTKQSFPTEKTRFTGDSTEIYSLNRELLAGKLGIESGQLIFPRQTHTSCVADIDEIPKHELKDTDALLTSKKGICICVQTADCVPILLYEPEKEVIAAVHAGWRGTVKKIASETVKKMEGIYRCDPAKIIAAIGPSISQTVYEVGSEVSEAIHLSIPNPDKVVYREQSGKHYVDLWAANREVLIGCGLNPVNIEIVGECSFSDSEKYYSARKEGASTGRMVSGIMLK